MAKHVCQLPGAEVARQSKWIDARPFLPAVDEALALGSTEAFSNSILNEIRRVVVNAKSTVIDLGRKRFFTGHARHAVMLQSNECVWPGCEIPTTKCQADHLTEHSRGGLTNPENGAPLCGGHNRWKDCGHADLIRESIDGDVIS